MERKRETAKMQKNEKGQLRAHVVLHVGKQYVRSNADHLIPVDRVFNPRHMGMATISLYYIEVST